MTRRTNRNRSRRAAKSLARHQERLKSTETEQQTTTGTQLVVDSDGYGHILEEGHEVRDARMAAKIISLGVVPEDVARGVLKKAFDLAEKTDEVSKFTALLRVIAAVAKVEQSAIPKRINHAHAHVAKPVEPEGSRISEINAKLGIRGMVD